MRISLSARSEKTGKRYVYLELTLAEENEILGVMRGEVLKPEDQLPKRVILEDGRIRYRFQRRHLERLVLAFPFAHRSPTVERSLTKFSEVNLEDVPDIEVPDFGLELLGFQKISLKAVLENWHVEVDRAGVHRRGGFMLNHGMGLGKTVIGSAALVKELAVPALVVCPNNAKYSVWLGHLADYTELEVTVADGTVQQRVEAIEQRNDVTVVNIEMLQKAEYVDALDYQYAAIITDEFHRFATPNTKQTKGWLTLHSDRALLMSGTPIMGVPEDSWSAMHKMFPRRYPSHWAFKRWVAVTATVVRHEKVVDPRTGKERVKKKQYRKVVGYKPEAMRALRKHIQDPKVSIRFRKDQVLDDLPQILESRLEVDLTAEQWKLYNQIKDEMRLKLESGELRTIKNMMVMVMRAKQACFSPELYGGSRVSAKLDELEKVVAQLVANGEKAIVFSQWKQATRIIQRRLSEYSPAYVDGTVKGKKRLVQETQFNEDPDCWVYIGTIRANREAITLGAATYVIFTDRDWNPMVNDQARDRSAAGGLRGAYLGKELKVTVLDLFAKGTVEERIDSVLAAKRNTAGILIERDGGPPLKRITVQDIADLF